MDRRRVSAVKGTRKRATVLPQRGRYEPPEDDSRKQYLEFLGSRIVFLIDWNRARRSLEQFVRRRDAIAILTEAADSNYGHRAYLELGGERLIADIVQKSAPIPVRFGERLEDVMGHDELILFLGSVLRATSEGLLNGRSQQLIRDELRAELATRFLSAEAALMRLVGDHAELIAELATAIWTGLMDRVAGGEREDVIRMSRRAKIWERRADDFVVRARADAGRSPGSAFCASLLISADDAADALEDAAFLFSLLPAVNNCADILRPVQTLGAILVEAAHEWIKAVESARFVGHSSDRDDVDDFLSAVDRLVALEHDADDSERVVTMTLLQGNPELRVYEVVSRVGAALEAASDSLTRSALALRDRTLAQMVSS